MLTYLGSATVGAWVPSLDATIVATLPDLQAQLAGAIALAAQLTVSPPTIAASLTFATDMVAAINAQITAGIVFPSLSAQLSAISSLVATITATVNLLLAFEAALGTAGVHGYAFSGQASALGPELTVATSGGFPGGGPTDNANALVLATTSPAAWAALSVVLQTS